MADGLGDLRRIHRIDLREIAAENDAAREQKRARVVLVARGIVAVGKEIAHALAAREPILIEAGDGQNVGNVDLLDELARSLDQCPAGSRFVPD